MRKHISAMMPSEGNQVTYIKVSAFTPTVIAPIASPVAGSVMIMEIWP
ncbi:hypothetical protein KMP13_17940 [Epibacterium ulvae]|nr:hypothetical protein [Epibacterium ulvae]MBT8155711.1 hypothetical protein [Epibacterium ulvae]